MTPRERRRAWALGLAIAACAWATPPAADTRPGDVRTAQVPPPGEMPGHRLRLLCDGVAAERPLGTAPDDAACAAYFQGVLDALETLRGRGSAYCVPRGVTLKQLIVLYKSESALYPHVLGLRASDLIAGMIVKFFPCEIARRAQGAPRLPAWKSSKACSISARVFMTKGPWRATGSPIGAPSQ